MTAPHEVVQAAGPPVGRSLRRAHQALRSALDAVLREEGVTSPQYSVLKLVREEPGLSSAELARRCFVTPQTMNEIVAGLESVALVTRAPHPQGGRRLEVAPTALGRRTLQRCEAVVERVEARLVAGLDGEQVRAAQAALDLFARNLERG